MAKILFDLLTIGEAILSGVKTVILNLYQTVSYFALQVCGSKGDKLLVVCCRVRRVDFGDPSGDSTQ